MPHRVAQTDTPAYPSSLDEKLKALISIKKRPDGEEFRQEEIAEGASACYVDITLQEAAQKHEHDGTPADVARRELEAIASAPALMSRSYVGKLLSGKQTNPSMNVLAALGAFFGVDPNYFFKGTPAEKEMNALLGLRTLKNSAARDTLFALARGVDDLEDPEAAMATLQMALSLVHHTQKMRNDSL